MKILVAIISAELLLVMIGTTLNRIHRSKKYKGKVGEKKVSVELKNLPSDYCIFRDVTIPSRGGTSQIDHVIVSVYGIFVIETKNYAGTIFGEEKNERWIQLMGEKSTFVNPIRQNWGHICALSESLRLPKDFFIPIVVFVGTATLNISVSSHVITLSELISCITSYQDVIFSPDNVKDINYRIVSSRLIGSNISRKHEANVRQRLYERDARIRSGYCPKCDGKLILRSGKYGQFYGCSRYPKCRYKHKVQ